MGHRTDSVQVEEGGPPARSWVTGQCTGRGGGPTCQIMDHRTDSVQVEEEGAHLPDHGSQDRQCTGRGGGPTCQIMGHRTVYR